MTVTFVLEVVLGSRIDNAPDCSEEQLRNEHAVTVSVAFEDDAGEYNTAPEYEPVAQSLKVMFASENHAEVT